MTRYREFANKLSHLLRRDRFDETLDDEVRLHLESRADELVATGITRREAQAQARREFGPTIRLAEESRDAWRWSWIEDLIRDLRHAARTLNRDRGFAATAVISLALGIGVNTTIFSLTAEFLFSEPSVRDPGTLMNAQVGGSTQAPMREYRFIRDARVFDGLAGALHMQEINWRIGDASMRLFVTRVTENFFDVTGVPLALGRPIRGVERGVAIISNGFWLSRLNKDPNVLGRVLILDGEPHTIIGLLPAVHRTLTGFGYSPDLYLPVVNDATSVAFFGRMPAGLTRAAALGRLKSAAAQMDLVYPDGNHKWANNVTVTGLVGMERMNAGMRPMTAFFGMLMAVVGLLLVIACANVASLLLARASARLQEFAIRMSIGAGRGRLIRQLLAESLLLSMLGTGAGLLMNYGLTRILNGLVLPLPFPLALAIAPDWRLLIYATIIGILSALLAGLLPAFTATRSGTSALLKVDEHQVSGRRAILRNVLVTGQIAVSVVVLIIAALSIRNLIQSSTLDPGFDIRRTIWAQMRLVPESYPSATRVRAMVGTTLDQVAALPGVDAATVATFVPLNDHFSSRSPTVYTDVVTQGERIEHFWNAIGPDYFKTMGIDVIAGREFNRLDREGSQRVAVISETFARRAFGRMNPLGRRVSFGRTDQVERTVVGIVRNSKYSTLGEKDRAALYEPFLQVGSGRAGLNFLVKANGSPESLLKPLNGALLAVDPASAIEAKPMSASMGFALLPSRMGAAMLGIIGLLGITLAAVGLYGVLAYSISRRTREIGLRVALGAQRPQVLRLVLSEGAWVLALGLTIGVVISVFVTRPLAVFLLPGLNPVDPLTYIAVGIILIVVGFAASLTPALRALRIDPMTALRYE